MFDLEHNYFVLTVEFAAATVLFLFSVPGHNFPDQGRDTTGRPTWIVPLKDCVGKHIIISKSMVQIFKINAIELLAKQLKEQKAIARQQESAQKSAVRASKLRASLDAHTGRVSVSARQLSAQKQLEDPAESNQKEHKPNESNQTNNKAINTVQKERQPPAGSVISAKQSRQEEEKKFRAVQASQEFTKKQNRYKNTFVKNIQPSLKEEAAKLFAQEYSPVLLEDDEQSMSEDENQENQRPQINSNSNSKRRKRKHSSEHIKHSESERKYSSEQINDEDNVPLATFAGQ